MSLLKNLIQKMSSENLKTLQSFTVFMIYYYDPQNVILDFEILFFR